MRPRKRGQVARKGKLPGFYRLTDWELPDTPGGVRATLTWPQNAFPGEPNS